MPDSGAPADYGVPMRTKYSRFFRFIAPALCFVAFATELGNPSALAAKSKKVWPSPQQYVDSMGKGMDVDWAKTRGGIEAYSSIAPTEFRKRGLGHVRIRIASAPTATQLRHIDRLVNDSLKAGLVPVIAYQGDEFKNDPSDANLAAVVQWWTTVSKRYANVSPKVSFDLLIEVTDALNDNQPQLDAVYEKAVTAIRVTNPKRMIFISPRVRSDPANLADLKIPSRANGYLAAEWHFYASGPSKTNPKKLWTAGSEAEKQIIRDKIATAQKWSASTGFPTWVGAWMAGNYNDGDDYTPAEQVAFATFTSCELDRARIPYAVNSDTKFFDRKTNVWVEPLAPVLDAIIRPVC
jgi:hypothetical protein